MNRTLMIHIRATPAEKASYNAAAKASGLELSQWLRRVADSAAQDIEVNRARQEIETFNCK